MNLKIANQLFIVGGATSGFGEAVAKALVAEGADIIAVARTSANLEKLKSTFPKNIETITGDITQASTIDKIMETINGRPIHGALVNAGGPPAMPALKTTLQDWDNAYRNVLRWKLDFTKKIIQKMMPQKYGRLVFVESVSVKQPVENLVLSNAMRLAVVGYVKTLSQEIAHHGITLNILGPGYHDTQRMENLFQKNSELKGVPVEAIKEIFIKQTKVGFLGSPDDFASLALWLLSPVSRYITGQTISVDGGLVQGTMG